MAEVASLRLLTLLLVTPSLVAAIVVGARHRLWGRRALTGLVAGLVATGCYDLLRLGGAMLGVWADPIPRVGGLLVGGPPGGLGWPAAGYAWRYLADGGALGAAYAVLPILGPGSGVVFGVGVCAGLLMLLALAPQAQQAFLPLTPVTALGALAGHLVYGLVLGWLARRWLRPRPALSVGLVRASGRRGLVDARAHTGPMAAAAPTAPRRANGPALAVVLAAGVGWATLGLLAAAGGVSPLLALMLTYTPSGGPLTGSATLAMLTAALTWGNLRLRWSGQWFDPAQALWVTLALIAMGLLGAVGCVAGSCLVLPEAR